MPGVVSHHDTGKNARVMARPALPFLEAVRKSIVVFDGAMGSLLYERGVFVTQNFEQLNTSRPEVVRRIHNDYLEAGANVLQTNTFGANRICLERHGLVGEVHALNLAGARLAREVAGDSAYVAGSIGPTGLVPGVSVFCFKGTLYNRGGYSQDRADVQGTSIRTVHS